MSLFRFCFVLQFCLATVHVSAADGCDSSPLFSDRNLVAWCIVPFDAKQRTPAQRAEMVSQLGLRRVAYDWRAAHVPEFEQEIIEYQKRGIEFFAFWSWHDTIEPLVRKHKIHPQFWLMMKESQLTDQKARIKDAAESLLPMVEKTRQLGCRLGIYNHGGWAGQPENMVAVADYLRRHHHADHVGIVYNFHHGHEHIARFRTVMNLMKPWLLCVNINGMADPQTVAAGQRKILPVGSGQHEKTMLQIVIDCGYSGPIGILDHRSELDAEQSLRENLTGLRRLQKQLHCDKR